MRILWKVPSSRGLSYHYSESSQARKFHPHVLTEPYVNLSIDTALLVQSLMYCYFTDLPIASAEKVKVFPCTSSSVLSKMPFCKVLSPIFPKLFRIYAMLFDVTDAVLQSALLSFGSVIRFKHLNESYFYQAFLP